jgi:hypothetical protein
MPAATAGFFHFGLWIRGFSVHVTARSRVRLRLESQRAQRENQDD